MKHSNNLIGVLVILFGAIVVLLVFLMMRESSFSGTQVESNVDNSSVVEASEGLSLESVSITGETHTNQMAHLSGIIEEGGQLYGVFDHLQSSQECEEGGQDGEDQWCYPSFENTNHKLRIYRFDEDTIFINHDTPVSRSEFLEYDFVYEMSWRLFVSVENGVLTSLVFSQAG